MLEKVLPAAVAALIAAVVPGLSLAQAPAEEAVALRARTTLSMAELTRNTAAGLATPVGIASSSGHACEVRCELADEGAAPSADGSVALRCATGEVRSVDDAADTFDALGKWSEGGMALAPAAAINLQSCD